MSIDLSTVFYVASFGLPSFVAVTVAVLVRDRFSQIYWIWVGCAAAIIVNMATFPFLSWQHPSLGMLYVAVGIGANTAGVGLSLELAEKISDERKGIKHFQYVHPH